ncbi:pentatricopeptide repeat-containing protein At2g45350, chloroplastic [Mangifera indica]|uniref:pentatricopeptide repeat-containing protein At2g45350, chloroplastic n=1 Tax=Mangifera indica TaxID=29780 RepID=UPI001CFB0BE3|nr:pentatricopeptide repeat-containing protein At2g45350, chloroplastic [Mangifera indica]
MLVFATCCQPWNSPPLPTLLLLRKCRTLNDVNQIHARLITTGLIKNTSLTAKIVAISSSSSCAPLVEFARYLFFTRQVFRIYKKHEDPFLWNAIIKSYSHGFNPRRALVVFCLMLETGVCFDNFSLSLVLKACSRVGLVKEGMQIHGLLRKIKSGSDLYLQNCLISLYLKCGYLESARQVFDKTRFRDSVSYNSMIDGYVKYGKLDSAHELFDSMPMKEKNLISWNSMISGYAQSKGGLNIARALFEKMPERDLISWNCMIDGCVKSGKMDDAQALFDEMPNKDVVTWANMIDGYAKIGRVDISRALFDEMPERDVVVCNAMMTGYLKNGCCMEALEVFHDMQCVGHLCPDDASILIILSAIAQLGHINKGIAVHRYLEQNEYNLNGKHGVALIDMYSKCGSIECAISVFEDIEKKSVDHWNAMINGFAIHGLGELAFDLLMEMERFLIEPDDITFVGVLNACGHAGLVKEGILCFELMRRVHKMEPKLQHYGCMVDILGRAGHIEEARKLIEDMPIEPNDVIWRTLLSACQTHENLTVAEPVAKHLIGMDSSNSSSYVLLSNMFAGLGMWNDVRRIRTMMKKQNLKKIPGCSWIELEGAVYEFFVQDKSHLQVTEICSMLDNVWT